MNEQLHANTKRLGLHPKHVAEVGVYLPETSNVLGFIKEGIRATLVEADPVCVRKIEDFFADKPNVQIHPIAVADTAGTVTFYRTGASTFAEDTKITPAKVNDYYAPKPEDRFTAPSKPFNEIDDGTIDLLSIDIEGGEWYVLKHLKSRPCVISTETHERRYKNPFLKEIHAWMRHNQYEVWYFGDTDTVFIQAGIVPKSLRRTLALWWKKLNLDVRYVGKRVQGKFKRIFRRIFQQKTPNFFKK